jgi:hypothetical protein
LISATSWAQLLSFRAAASALVQLSSSTFQAPPSLTSLIVPTMALSPKPPMPVAFTTAWSPVTSSFVTLRSFMPPAFLIISKPRWRWSAGMASISARPFLLSRGNTSSRVWALANASR